MRSWFSSRWFLSHRERVAYALAGVLLVVSIGSATAGAVLLRQSANSQRQETAVEAVEHRSATRAGAAAAHATYVRLSSQAQGRIPYARWTLLAAVIAFILLVGVLVWLFELQRRAGRIDRDHARVRDEFVAVVSHELRTPLTSILGYIELLGESELDDEQRSYFGVVERNANRLLYLVSDLLLVAESDDGLRLDLHDVDLAAIVHDSVEAARAAADAKQIEVVSSTTPARLEGDAVRLAQMIDNLLSNAIKYTPDGGRVVVTGWVADDRAWLEVTDSGIGIAAADRQQIFERFYRVRGMEATGGAGLGLAITKAIVEAHGGTISVASELGAGTSFRVSFPLQELQPVPPRVGGVEATSSR